MNIWRLATAGQAADISDKQVRPVLTFPLGPPDTSSG